MLEWLTATVLALAVMMPIGAVILLLGGGSLKHENFFPVYFLVGVGSLLKLYAVLT